MGNTSTHILSIVLPALVLTACSPGLLFGPTYTPTSSLTPTRKPTSTAILTNTPSITSTPLPGLGVTSEEIVETFGIVEFMFSPIPDIHGQSAQKGITSDQYMSITLIGDPFLYEAILQIDLANENSFIATAVWIMFLETTSHGGKAAADWVHEAYPEAVVYRQAVAVFGNARITLEASGDQGEIFRLTVQSLQQP